MIANHQKPECLKWSTYLCWKSSSALKCKTVVGFFSSRVSMLHFCLLQICEIFWYLTINRAFETASYLKKWSRLRYRELIQEDTLDAPEMITLLSSVKMMQSILLSYSVISKESSLKHNKKQILVVFSWMSDLNKNTECTCSHWCERVFSSTCLLTETFCCKISKDCLFATNCTKLYSFFLVAVSGFNASNGI